MPTLTRAGASGMLLGLGISASFSQWLPPAAARLGIMAGPGSAVFFQKIGDH
jgi:hypothetical protein